MITIAVESSPAELTMLKFLALRNFALIDHLEVDFRTGLNLITGETGSGKSILVDAVGLLVGERASQEMIRHGFDRARVEGIFDLPPQHPARPRLEAAEIPLETNELIIRRELFLSGNNKVFVNGVLTTQGLLSELGELLAEVHGQHEQQQLLRPATQLDFLDAFAGNGELRHLVAGRFRERRGLRARIEELRKTEQERLRRLDTLQYQLADIEKLQLHPGLDQALEEEHRLLASAEMRLKACEESFRLLYEQDASCCELLNRVEKNIEQLAALDGHFGGRAGRLRDLRYQLEETALELRDYINGIEFNPSRLEMIQERLAEIGQARRKYGASLDEILAYALRIGSEIEELAGGETRLEELQAREHSVARAYREAALKLSEARKKAAQALEKRMKQELHDLNMENSLLSIHVASSPEHVTEKGIDHIEFLISANRGEAPKPLARIVSGGELSRTVLALKSILTLEDYPKTVVFDEVDAGIGGRVASKVGEKLARLAEQHQVFCVTHLPQIAAYAGQHFAVLKRPKGDRTVIEITALSPEGRIEEMARMTAGSSVTETTRRQARELLERTGPPLKERVSSAPRPKAHKR